MDEHVAPTTSWGEPLPDHFGDGEAPGRYPYTRGIDARGYRDELWVMGQYSGYGSPERTNRRLRDLIGRGQTGFSIALDLPTQNGLDSDHPLARGEVGRVGVPIDTLRDMEVVLDGIPLDRVRQIRTTANAYTESALRRGVAFDDFAPHVFLFLSASLNVLEEAAKFRAARRIWAR